MTNLEVESNKRATILSASNLAQTLGMAIIAPLLGYVADLWSINTAYFFAGISNLVAVLFFLSIRDKK
jgi:sugar phosphate permease